MTNLLGYLIWADDAQDLIEYAFLGCAIGLGAIMGAQLLGTALNAWYFGVEAAGRAGAASVVTIAF